jgi:hypothetical protein
MSVALFFNVQGDPTNNQTDEQIERPHQVSSTKRPNPLLNFEILFAPSWPDGRPHLNKKRQNFLVENSLSDTKTANSLLPCAVNRPTAQALDLEIFFSNDAAAFPRHHRPHGALHPNHKVEKEDHKAKQRYIVVGRSSLKFRQFAEKAVIPTLNEDSPWTAASSLTGRETHLTASIPLNSFPQNERTSLSITTLLFHPQINSATTKNFVPRTPDAVPHHLAPSQLCLTNIRPSTNWPVASKPALRWKRSQNQL